MEKEQQKYLYIWTETLRTYHAINTVPTLWRNAVNSQMNEWLIKATRLNKGNDGYNLLEPKEQVIKLQNKALVGGLFTENCEIMLPISNNRCDNY